MDLEAQNLHKTFGGVAALDDVTLSIRSGECHALVGENGAGKSTLGRIIAGILRPDRGKLVIDGRAMEFRGPADAIRAGIGMVHQELAFCPDLSVAENLHLGRYPRCGPFVRLRRMEAQARAMLSDFGVALDVRTPLRRLSTAQEQIVQIVAAMATGARLLILDEPTSSLAEAEARRLFALLESLKSRGVTLIYVSHRLPEVFRLADRISVLRDGRIAGSLTRADASEDRLVQLMIGRSLERGTRVELGAEADATVARKEPRVLEVEGLSSPGRFAQIGFALHAHEIVGLAGLVGAGRTEIARALFGLDPAARGIVRIAGRTLTPGDPRAAVRAGLGLVPEDRKRQGLVPGMSGRANTSLATLDRLSRLSFLDRGRERRQAHEQFRNLDIRAPSIETPVAQLSGGNQQKVVLARWLARDLKVLIVDEPTRGVDVGAKQRIHETLEQLAAAGRAILLISSDLPELIALSHRVLVVRGGRLVGEVARRNATQECLLRLMAGIDKQVGTA